MAGAGGPAPPDGARLYACTAGFLTGRIRRILTLAGYRPRLGLPGKDETVAVWGRGLRAGRGEALARWRGARILRVEDAFLRSIRPGRAGDPPLGLLLDAEGVHYDSSRPSALEQILTGTELDDAELLRRAEAGMARLRRVDLSKYNDFDPDLRVPDAGYVLVVDQVRDDASIRYGGADAARFAAMLAAARAEHPGARIVVKSHPETVGGLRPGHFSGVAGLLVDPVSPWRLLSGARAVYTVSSQLGMEAIFAGHRPHVFGQPAYAGWDLTEDRAPPPRRGRALTPAQLFAAAYLLAPVWYDPCRDRLCSFETAVDQLEAEVRAFREDRRGHVALGMRLWKRGGMQRIFGRERSLVFERDPVRARARALREGRDLLVWATSAPGPAPAAPPVMRRVEDGFLRSRGLGAALVPALSLVTDRQGIHYDPHRASDLEDLIARPLSALDRHRANGLIEAIRAAGLSKYNLRGQALPSLPASYRILVPGQVEDDASIRFGAGEISTNLALLARVRADNPDSIVIFKPHPDVEAGLRAGAVPPAAAGHYADVIAAGADPITLIGQVDEVWTMTSLLGFEALLRGRAVTCLGAPFYAGWGLTRDLGAVPARRSARPDLVQLVHAALIAYPRYHDPRSGLPCPPEVIIERLAGDDLPHPGQVNRLLSKMQGAFASYAHLWR